jgi:hypothetical protein
LFSYELSPDDPNFEAYAAQMEGVDFNAPVKFYTHQIDEMIRAEKGALFVDYKHLTTFRWNDQTFLDNLFSEYSRFEPYLRKAILQFV